LSVDSVGARFRTRLLPALLLALGVALVGNGLLSFTTAVEPGPVAEALESYVPLPTIDAGINLPGGGGNGATQPSFPPDRVATRIVIRKLRIDLPVIQQPPEAGDFPLCDVAMYFTALGQPGSGRATYIYAHARRGMFLPLLTASQRNNGAAMIGDLVEVYTSDNYLFIYQISEVRRHTHDLIDALNDTDAHLWLQTSEGPNNSYPKLQIVADFQSADPTNPNAAHPEAHPRQCQ
jgi:sortase family protein